MSEAALVDGGMAAELERVKSAYSGPVLRLLGSRTAVFQVAAMRAVFGSDRISEDYAVIVSRLDESLDLTPEEDRPAVDGRRLVKQWLDMRLLRSDDGDEGSRVLTFTSAAQMALRVVAEETSTRPLLGESRVAAIADAISELAERTSGSVEARKARIRRQIEELTAELERLEAGGEIEDLSGDDVLDRTSHLLDMTRTLPEQFTKVAEAIRDNHHAVAGRLRADERPQGLIVLDYLEEHEGLSATAEGRAYSSAIEILRSDDRLGRLSDDISTFLAHPAVEVLTDAERAGLANLESDLRGGIQSVRVEHRRVTDTFARYLHSSDPVADREVVRVLKEANAAMQEWMTAAGRRDVVELPIGFERALDLGRLPAKWPDPDDYAAPSDPTVDPGPGGAKLDLSQLRSLGGPRTADVLRRMPELARAHQSFTLGAMFEHLPDELARPVELVGLIAEARAIGARMGVDITETVIGRRADGTTRELRIPLIHLTDDGVMDVAALTEGRDA